jgi:dynein heavy chain 1
VPRHWLKFKIAKNTSLAQYIANLSARLAQLEDLAKGTDDRKSVWLGGLFQPEAYVTATRQTVAHKNGWSLEQLSLSVALNQTSDVDAFSIEGESKPLVMISTADVIGLKLEGADWSDSGLTLNDGRPVALGASQLTWRKSDTVQSDKQTVNLPVYLNGDRADVLFAVDLVSVLGQDAVAQRGVCLTAA